METKKLKEGCVIINTQQENPYRNISDKLGNPIDAIDTYIQLIKNCEGYIHTKPLVEELDKLVEKMKIILSEYKSKEFTTQQETFTKVQLENISYKWGNYCIDNQNTLIGFREWFNKL